MIAAGVVIVLGGGIAVKFMGGSSAKPTQTVEQHQADNAPANGSPVDATSGVPVPPPSGAAAPDPVQAQTADKSAKPADVKATPAVTPPVQTAPQVTAAATTPAPAPAPAPTRAAPKQFVAPTVQSRPTATNQVVVDAAPELALNVQGGTVAIPSANNITGRVPAPPPPPAPKQEAPAANNAPAPAAAKPAPPPVPQTATLTRIKTVAPEYPAMARANKIQGTVIFAVTVGKDGKVSNLKAISGQPLLLPAAKNAISQWVYKPPTVNGQPTEANINVELNFTIK